MKNHLEVRMNTIVGKIGIHQFVSFIVILCAFCLNSCNKYEYDISNEESSLLNFKSKFKEDSTTFYKNFDKTNYNYRQSLTRIIHWEKAKLNNDTVRIPITLQLPQGQTNAETGKNTLNQNVYLVAYKKNNSDYTFQMITFIGERSSMRKFSGVVYIEDFFKGDVRYNTYLDGVPSRTKSIDFQVQKKLATTTLKDKMIANTLSCNWTKIGKVCVGHPTNDREQDICNDRYEYQCIWTNENVIMDEDDWGGDSGGGGAGNNGNSVVVLSPAVTINLKDRLNCFKNVPDNVNTKYNVTLHVDKTTNYVMFPGHSFITLEKSNGSNVQRLSFGFYPKTSNNVIIGLSQPIISEIGEESLDGERESDIRYNLRFDSSFSTKFQSLINLAVSLSQSMNYDLNDYNCTNYAIDVFNYALTSTSKSPLPQTTTPNSLFDIMNNMSNNNIEKNKIGEGKLPKSTNCK